MIWGFCNQNNISQPIYWLHYNQAYLYLSQSKCFRLLKQKFPNMTTMLINLSVLSNLTEVEKQWIMNQRTPTISVPRGTGHKFTRTKILQNIWINLIIIWSSSLLLFNVSATLLLVMVEGLLYLQYANSSLIWEKMLSSHGRGIAISALCELYVDL